MELRHLRYFVAVAEDLHFGRAAARLRIAQPPLSQQIKRLETLLGAELLRRTRRRVELTEAGRVLLEGARPLLEDADRLEEATRRAGRGETGRLALGFVGSATHDVLPRLLRGFRERAPDVSVGLVELSSQAQAEALAARRIAAGLLRLPVADPGIAVLPLLEERLVAALPDFHPLARQGALSLSALADEPLVLFRRENNPAFYDDVVDACRAAGFSPRILQEAWEMLTVVSVVAAGLGVSVVPASVQGLRPQGVAYRPLTDAAVRLVVALAWRPADASPMVEALVDVARRLWPDPRGQLRRAEMNPRLETTNGTT